MQVLLRAGPPGFTRTGDIVTMELMVQRIQSGMTDSYPLWN